MGQQDRESSTQKTTATSIGSVALKSFVLNASGPGCTTPEELHTLGRSGSSAIMMKSCTIDLREGNIEPRFARLSGGNSLQSMGLPNLGYQAYLQIPTELKKRYQKPVIASIAGPSVEDFRTMAIAFQQDSDVDMIDVNIGCPSLKGKSQIGDDFEQSARVFDAVCGHGDKPLMIKLPAYFGPSGWDQMATLILQYKEIAAISCVNSIGNVLVIDPETESTIIKPNHGLGGLGGPFMKWVALSNVNNFYRRLKGKVSIIGVGGVLSGQDAFEFVLAGADAIGVATIYESEGPSCFGRIDRELAEVLHAHEYASVADAKGKLKFL